MSYHGGRWHICVSWLSHTSTNTNFFPTDYFSRMLQQRSKTEIHRKEILPQPSLELTTTQSRVRHAHHWATQAGPSRGETPVKSLLQYIAMWLTHIAICIAICCIWHFTYMTIHNFSDVDSFYWLCRFNMNCRICIFYSGKLLHILRKV